MKPVAAVCRKPGEPLVMEEIIVAPPMPREARIRIICTSLCHSDITFWKMKVFFPLSFKKLVVIPFFKSNSIAFKKKKKR